AITDVVGKTGLSAAATGGNGHLHYAVSPTTVATIDNKGVLKLLKPGLATVTVTDDGDVNHKKQSQTTSVTVLGKAQTFNAPQLTFGTSPFPLKVNGQSLPPGTTCKSSDISILSVGAKCMLTPKKAGGPVTLTVNIPHKAPSIITGVKVEKAVGTAANGHPLKAHAAITDVVGKTSVNAAATGGNGHLHYAVSPTTVARIDNKGVLKLLKQGLATVTVTDDGDVNHKKQSQTTVVTVLGKAPEIKNLSIKGTQRVGSVLTGFYQYTDADGDLQGASMISWLRDGKPIPGANTLSYTLKAEDAGTVVTLSVQPVSKTGTPNKGINYFSKAGNKVTSAHSHRFHPHVVKSGGLTWLPPMTVAQYREFGITIATGPTQDGFFTHADAISMCQAIKVDGNSDWRLPTVDEYVDLNNAQGDMKAAHGWPSDVAYFWSATSNSPGYYNAAYLNGSTNFGIPLPSSQSLLVACVSGS
ncbi:DUF1566 domain-containing protein, partial [Vibrio mediterranei]|uniref:DUF1566 domain-containing protein n=1 Tax=Vibrio mediterranei TaxID=689 RepID=UPI001EFE3AE3